MPKELAKVYKPSEFEKDVYQMWLDRKYFHAEPDSSKKPFTIVIPPPNVTGQLHMGHALDETLQDILIRYKRMQGYKRHCGFQVRITRGLQRKSRLSRYCAKRRGFPVTIWDARSSWSVYGTGKRITATE